MQTATDIHLIGTFRQPIGIPDEIFPDAWKKVDDENENEDSCFAGDLICKAKVKRLYDSCEVTKAYFDTNAEYYEYEAAEIEVDDDDEIEDEVDDEIWNFDASSPSTSSRKFRIRGK
jgi:hypothetical protein